MAKKKTTVIEMRDDTKSLIKKLVEGKESAA